MLLETPFGTDPEGIESPLNVGEVRETFIVLLLWLTAPACPYSEALVLKHYPRSNGLLELPNRSGYEGLRRANVSPVPPVLYKRRFVSIERCFTALKIASSWSMCLRNDRGIS